MKYGLIGGNENDKYVVRSQNYFETAVFDKIQSAAYPILGKTLVNLQYKTNGEYKINEDGKKGVDYTSISLSATSIAGDLKLSSFFEKAGAVVSFLNWLGVGKSLVNAYLNLKSFALEDLTCSLFVNELSSNSPQITEKLYLFAKKRLTDLEFISKLSVDYDYLGSITSYNFSDPIDLEVIKSDINNYKRELMYGVNYE
ncbi:hypothetical protein H0R92_10920 [Treponema sp. OMZ 840]|uniref:hypothetical protein n=1 Tax=Treponema sp. OMZ 840 TaxID=244313 RepID=UPI003D9112C1